MVLAHPHATPVAEDTGALLIALVILLALGIYVAIKARG